MNSPQERTYQAYDYRIRFRWTEDYFREAIEKVVICNWKVVSGVEPDTTFSLFRRQGQPFSQHNDEEPTLVAESVDGLFEHLKKSVHIDLASYAPGLVFVHAGVVLTEFGLVVLPGRSFAGKSTLVRELLNLGARYYSDEYAVIRSDDQVLPFPRRLSLRIPEGIRTIEPQELGWTPDLGPAPVAMILSTSYVAETHWEPEELTTGQATLEMFANTVSARLDPERAVRYLPKAAERALCLRGERGEAGPTAKAVLARLQSLRSSV